jgi:hypothetical protein
VDEDEVGGSVTVSVLTAVTVRLTVTGGRETVIVLVEVLPGRLTVTVRGAGRLWLGLVSACAGAGATGSVMAGITSDARPPAASTPASIPSRRQATAPEASAAKQLARVQQIDPVPRSSCTSGTYPPIAAVTLRSAAQRP